MKNIFILIILIFLSNNLFHRTNACTCAPPESPEVEYHNYDAIFRGKAVEISFISWYGYPYRLVKFEVDKQWKGFYNEEVIVITAANSAACGYDFVLDTLYLVYANLNNDTLSTHLCTRTNPIWKADKDLAYLNSIDVKQGLQPFGLQDKVITSLAIEQPDNNNFLRLADYIFAGTEENGVFRALADDENPDWVLLGLEDKQITALTIQHWGAGPADGLKLFAAVKPDYEKGDSTLIFSSEVYLSIDSIWAVSDSGINKNVNSINALNSYYFTGHTAPEPVLAGTNHGLYRGSWAGNFWIQSEIEVENLQPVISSIDVNPHWFGNLAWAAGSIGSSPSAFRSTDKGATWKPFTLMDIEGEAASSVVINPRYPDSVYVSWNTNIYLTADNGNNWKPVFSSRGIIINTLAVDPLHPENVFAGGWFFDDSHQSPDQGIFFHSTNGGKDWNQSAPIVDILLEKVTSIVVIRKPNDSNGYVYIGTEGTGIWSYKYPIFPNNGSLYFPLAINNEWNYTSNLFPYSEKITDSIRINNKLYFGLSIDEEEPYLFFRQSGSKVFVLDIADSIEVMLYDLNAEIGESWELPERFYCSYGKDITLVSKNDTIETPSGTFYNCYHFRHNANCADAGITDTWLAKGIGKVRYKAIFFAGEGDFVLSDYIVTSINNNSLHQKDISFRLFQNYPNPFNPSTTIKYELSRESEVKLVIYNMLGEKVADLVNAFQKAGQYEIEWNALSFASGVYLYQIKAENFISTKKLILMK